MWLQNITLTEVCNIIVLISAVIIAGKNIWEFFKKPVDDLQVRANAREEEHIEEVIDRRVPELLATHSEKVKGERNHEEACRAQSIKDDIIAAVEGRIDELKNMTVEQDKQLSSLIKSMDLLTQSQMDMMRYDMNRIYYKYRQYKKILSADKKAFIKIYHDYKSMDGNTWIDALYAELKDWPIVEDWSELKGDN